MTFLLGHSDHGLDHSHRDSDNHGEGNDRVREKVIDKRLSKEKGPKNCMIPLM